MIIRTQPAHLMRQNLAKVRGRDNNMNVKRILQYVDGCVPDYQLLAPGVAGSIRLMKDNLDMDNGKNPHYAR